VTSVTYPTTSYNQLTSVGGAPPQGIPAVSSLGTTYNYTFDALARLNGMADSGTNTDVSSVSYYHRMSC